MSVAATVITTPPAHAQASLGTILVGDPVTCPSNFYSGMTCQGAEIFCSNTDNIGLTIGYVTQATTPKGTIVFFTGGGGTASDFGPTNGFADSYVGSYVIVYVEWASAWEKAKASGTKNILYAACRPATLLHWVSSSLRSSGAMCAQGKSAGSAAIAYAMSWYGADSYLTNVELLAGPVLTEIDQGCTYNPPPPNVTMCNGQSWCQSSYGSLGGWTTSAGYTSDKLGDISSWTGVSDCETSSITSTELTTLQHMSIVGGVYGTVTPKYNFNTKRHGWVCAGPNTNYDNYATDCPSSNAFCPNNSSPQGWYWYNQASDPNMVLSGTNQCDGTTTSTTSTEAEGVDGTNAKDPVTLASERSAIVSDMENKCQ